MTDRVDAVGGILTVDSATGTGTTITGWIPTRGEFTSLDANPIDGEMPVSGLSSAEDPGP